MDMQKDEDFEKSWQENRHIWESTKDLAKAMFYAGQAKAQAVPEGFVLVPKEPTQEMLNKMQDFFVGAFENGLTGGQSIHCAYIAMIEAQEPANES